MIHIYLRRSTSNQAISPIRQLEDINRFLSDSGKKPDEIWSEEPVSGKAGLKDRPVLAKLLHTLDNKDTLVVASPSRLARSQLVYQTILAVIAQKQINVLFADGTELDLNNSISILLGNIHAFVAEQERKAISHRTKQALRIISRTKALGAPDKIRFGYDAGTNREYVPNPVEQEIGTHILSLQSQGMTQKNIARWLNDQGYRTRRGTTWKQSRISKLISSFRPERTMY